MLELLARPWRAMVVDEWLARSICVAPAQRSGGDRVGGRACAYETANRKVPVAPAEWIAANVALFMSSFVDGRGFADNGDMSDESADAAQLRLALADGRLPAPGKVESSPRCVCLKATMIRPLAACADSSLFWRGSGIRQRRIRFGTARPARCSRSAHDAVTVSTSSGFTPSDCFWKTPIANEAARKLCRAESKASGAPGWFWSSLEAVAEVRLGDRAPKPSLIEPSREDGFVALNDALRAAWLRREVVQPAVFDAWATRFAAAGYQRIADEFAVARAISEAPGSSQDWADAGRGVCQ
jgi:hypothetical protein